MPACPTWARWSPTRVPAPCPPSRPCRQQAAISWWPDQFRRDRAHHGLPAHHWRRALAVQRLAGGDGQGHAAALGRRPGRRCSHIGCGAHGRAPEPGRHSPVALSERGAHPLRKRRGHAPHPRHPQRRRVRPDPPPPRPAPPPPPPPPRGGADFRNWLLAHGTDSAMLAAVAPGITPEMAAAVSKLMRNQDLIAVARKCRVVTRFRNTIGLPGHLAVRLQPNHPTDDLRGIAASMIDGLLYGTGDAVIGVNPATDSIAALTGLVHMLGDVIERLQIPTQ